MEESGWYDACTPPGSAGLGEPCDFPTCGEPGGCAEGLVCWDNLCLKQCDYVGAAEVYECQDPLSFCMYNEGTSILPCSIPCDPFGDTCPDGMSCQLEWDTLDTVVQFPACTPRQTAASYGEACDIWADALCDPGLVCQPSTVMPMALCGGTDYCCTPYCDLTAPQCPDAALGIECVPVYEPGQAPPGLENLGTCMLPQ